MKKSVIMGNAMIALMTLFSLPAFARLVRIIPPDELMANSKLVFVGKVQSVETSSVATSLSYPTWEGVSFPWLKVEVEVSAPVKGVKPGEIVHVMMLSIDNRNQKPMLSAPEVLEPDKGDIFLFCLGPTSITNSFAALTAPYDEFLSVIPLHRNREIGMHTVRGVEDRFLLNDQRFALIRKLVNESGETVPDAMAKLRETYAGEIIHTPTNQMICLEWQARTNTAGWVSDAPKNLSPTNSVQK